MKNSTEKGVHFLQQISSKGMEGVEGVVIKNTFKELHINDFKLRIFLFFSHFGFFYLEIHSEVFIDKMIVL